MTAPSKVTIRLMGGLGNQLFQFAAGEYLRDRGAVVRFDTGWFGAPRGQYETDRQLEVSPLLASFGRCHIRWPLSRAIYSSRNPRLIRELGPNDDVLGRLPDGKRLLLGYFQRAAPALAAADNILVELEPSLAAALASPLPEAIGVHVRLGDYVGPASRSLLGLTGPRYYAEALEMLRRDGWDLPVRVFTDSPDLFETAYEPHFGVPVEVSTAAGSWEVLAQLSSCPVIVTSNSSLSWWAAFVASVRDPAMRKCVVAPRPWMRTASEMDGGLMLEGWRQLEREPDMS